MHGHTRGDAEEGEEGIKVHEVFIEELVSGRVDEVVEDDVQQPRDGEGC